jgi:hypothetical protein
MGKQLSALVEETAFACRGPAAAVDQLAFAVHPAA